MEENEKIEEKRGLTAKIFVLGLVVCFFGAWFYGASFEAGTVGAQPSGWNYNLAFVNADAPLAAFAGGLILIAILSLINRAKPIFSKQEMAIILIITVIACALPSPLSQWNYQIQFAIPWAWVKADATTQEQFLELYKDSWLLPGQFSDIEYATKVAEGSLAAGNAMPIDFAAWTPFFGYVTLSAVAMGIVGLAVALLVQKIYIEEEGIEFPWGEMNIVGLDQIHDWFNKPKVGESVRSKWFIIGFLPLFLLYFSMYGPNEIGWLFKTGPAFKTWQSGWTWDNPAIPEVNGVWGPWELRVTELGLAFLPYAAITIFLQPHVYGGLYLIPMDVLIGVCAGSILMTFILPSVMYSMGAFEDVWEGGELKSVWRDVFTEWPGASWTHAGRFHTVAWFVFGLVLPLVIVPLWTHRATFGRILKSIAGARVGKEADENPPMRYSYVWWMLIIGAILLILSFSYAPLDYVLNGMVSNIILLFSEARLVTGGATFVSATYSYFDMDPAALPTGTGFTVHRLNAAWFLRSRDVPFVPEWNFYSLFYGGHKVGTGGAAPEQLWIMIMALSIGLMAFYIASRTNVRKKDVLVTLLVFVPLTLILSQVWRLLFVHWVNQFSGEVATPAQYAYTTSTVGPDWSKTFSSAGNQRLWLPVPEIATAYWTAKFGAMVVGIIVTSVMYFMRSRFGWFRVEPAGFFLGSFIPGMMPAAIIAVVLKYLTVKVGGAEVYQRVGKPISVGFLLAYGANWFLHHGLQALFLWQTALGL